MKITFTLTPSFYIPNQIQKIRLAANVCTDQTGEDNREDSSETPIGGKKDILEN